MWKVLYKSPILLALFAYQSALVERVNAAGYKFTIGLDYVATYNKINQHLIAKLKGNDNVKDNMDEIQRKSNSESRKNSLSLNYLLKRALKQILELRTIEDGSNKCDMDSYKILVKNNVATENRIFKSSKDKTDRRIDKIIRHYTEKHAEECWKTYEDQYKFQCERLNKEFIGRAEMVTYQIFRDSHLLREPYIVSVRGYREGGRVLTAMDLLTVDDEDAKYLKRVNDEGKGLKVVRDDKVKELFKKYVLEPCEYYIDQLGAIIIPAKYDTKTVGEPGVDATCKFDHYKGNFVYSLTTFRLCNSIVNNDSKYVLKNVLDHIDYYN